jgi:heme/copper-type cytochrome/quinol oxidase subunit 2
MQMLKDTDVILPENGSEYARKENEKAARRLGGFRTLFFCLAALIMLSFLYVCAESGGFNGVLIDEGIKFVSFILLGFSICIFAGILTAMEYKESKRCTDAFLKYTETNRMKKFKWIIVPVAVIGIIMAFSWAGSM